MTETATTTAAAPAPEIAAAHAAALRQETAPSSTLIIGSTGSGKSTLLATAAEYIWEEFHKILYLYSSDPGGFPAKIQALVRLGIMRVWRMRTRGDEIAFETCYRASQGWWPAKINPLTGESPRGVQMVPPLTVTYRQACLNCGHPRVSLRQADLASSKPCAQCQKMITPDTPITVSTEPSRGFADRGGVAFDGITSMGDWMLQDMAHRKDLEGEKAALGGRVASGDLSFGGNNRAQVGFAQTRQHELVTNATAIPGLVIAPLWTALVCESSDDAALPIIGPKLAGNAKTEIAPTWFGNTLEATVEAGDKPNTSIRRLRTTEYVDAANRRHLLKHRGDIRKIPSVLDDEPIEVGREHEARPCEGNFSLRVFFQLLDTSVDHVEQEYQTKYPDAPGIVLEDSGFQTFGHADAADAAAASAPVPTSAPTGKVGAPRPKAGAPRPKASSPASTIKPTAAPPPAASPSPASPADPAPSAPAPPPAAPEPSPEAPAPARAEASTPVTAPTEPAATPAPVVPPAPAPAASAASPARPVMAAPPGARPGVAPPRRPPSGRPVPRPVSK